MQTVSRFIRPPAARFVTTVIIGAGQAGLAMSHCLSEASIDHVILERGEVANSWHKERWDSLKLLSPNWQSRLPGHSYQGNNPDGFMDVKEVISYLSSYANRTAAPIHTGVTVTKVSQTQNGYRIETSEGEWQCRTLVIASGACNIPVVPKIDAALPDAIERINPMQYKNPEQLREGGVLVVGASATGLQLASEIQKSGRQVTVAVGEQVRMPRQYRGRDVMWWMDQSGLLDQRYDEIDDLDRSRHLPSAQLVGGDLPRDLDINNLRGEGVEFAGRLAYYNDQKLQFSGSLANVCKMADLKMRRMIRHFDDWAEQQEFAHALPEAHEIKDTTLPASPRLDMDLANGEIKTIVWATGFRPDYSWLNVPVLDNKGNLKHDGGVVDAPGLYVLGLPFQRRRKSVFLDGVGDDARELTTHMQAYLHNPWPQAIPSVA